MSCLASEGIMFCQFTPVAWAVIAFAFVAVGVLLNQSVGLVISRRAAN